MSAIDSTGWLYLKVYLNMTEAKEFKKGYVDTLADQLLSEHVLPELRRLYDDKLSGGYFFIRYADDGYHLRIRVKPRPNCVQACERGLEKVILAFAREHPEPFGGAASIEALRDSGQMVRARYEPEQAKYCGVHGLRVAEQHFQVCADLTRVVLTLKRSHNLRKQHLAFWLTGRIMFDLGLEPEEMIAIVSGYSQFWQASYAGFSRDEVGQLLGTAYEQKKPGLAMFLPQSLSDLGTAYERQNPIIHAELNPLILCFCSTVREFEELEGEGLLDGTPYTNIEASIMPSVGQAVPNSHRFPLTYYAILPNLIHMMNNRLGIDVLKEAQIAYMLARYISELFAVEAAPQRIKLEPYDN